MAANPLYYTHRHSNQVQAACPTMTQERYMEGWDRANSLVNTMIGIANEVARLAISDGIDAIKRAGKYRQKTKQLCNETFRRQEEYESIHNQNFGDRLKLWLDYLDGTEDEYRRHIFNIYVQTDDPKQYINLNDDANLRLAADVLARKLSDSDVLNRIGKHAIEQNLEVARRFSTDEDLKELGVID